MIEIKTDGIQTQTTITCQDANKARDEICAACAGAIMSFYQMLLQNGCQEFVARKGVREMVGLIGQHVETGFKGKPAEEVGELATGLTQ